MALGLQRNSGMLVLAVFLILYGLNGFIAIHLPPSLLGVLAVLAGVLILVGR
jgi:hypothetical protein